VITQLVVTGRETITWSAFSLRYRDFGFDRENVSEYVHNLIRRDRERAEREMSRAHEGRADPRFGGA
jgi:hypothetical protein